MWLPSNHFPLWILAYIIFQILSLLGNIKHKGQMSLLKFNCNIYPIIDQFKVKNNLLCHVHSDYKMFLTPIPQIIDFFRN